jgi:hypothetical protein
MVPGPVARKSNADVAADLQRGGGHYEPLFDVARRPATPKGCRQSRSRNMRAMRLRGASIRTAASPLCAIRSSTLSQRPILDRERRMLSRPRVRAVGKAAHK